MRGRLQLELSASDYRDAKKGERVRALQQLLKMLDTAFQRREEWYMWILETRPGTGGRDA